MIHIATVHWKDARWIDIQLKYIRKHIEEPTKVYSFLNHIDDFQIHKNKFEFATDEPVASHAIKLNILAWIAHERSIDHKNDLIMFLDGDAFPIGPITNFARSKLTQYPLVAVQRLENGDIQPHPCCCITTLGFWREIEGDWKQGHTWKSPSGEMVTDVGGNLLRNLERASIPWFPMLRSNLNNPHPVFFGIYSDVIYHHGAGFRPAQTRADHATLSQKPLSKIERLARKLPNDFGIWRLRERLAPTNHARQELQRENELLSSRIFSDMASDDEFYKQFMD